MGRGIGGGRQEFKRRQLLALLKLRAGRDQPRNGLDWGGLSLNDWWDSGNDSNRDSWDVCC